MYDFRQESGIDVIADEAPATNGQARLEARRRDAEAAAVLADPLAPLRERLGELEEQIGRLRCMHRNQGDAVAGRLIGTLERERAEILAKTGQSAAESREEA